MYLAEKYNKFYEQKDRNLINQWLDGTNGNDRTNAWSTSSVSSL